jgi:hypothetical protein
VPGQLYTDTAVYYLGMAALTVLGAFGSGAEGVARGLRRRVRVPGVARCGALHPYPEGATVGELLVVLATAALYSWWLWWWRWGYTRIAEEGDEAHHLDNSWATVNGSSTNGGGKCCAEFGIPPPPNGSSWAAGDAGRCETRPDTPGMSLYDPAFSRTVMWC